MHKAAATFAVACAALAGAAFAQSQVLTAEEVRRELFGVELIGVHERDGDSWRECIDPNGRTLYEAFGRSERGRLAVTADGRACFTYDGDSYTSCFVVQREGAGYRFEDFVTRSVRRGVTNCARGEDLISTLPGGALGR
ncbi:MAG: hypothetical protein AB7O98_05995 [Hyphomonadaceae bacterium]